MIQTITMTQVLRWFGVTAMIIAVINFLVTGHYDLNGTDASFIFLGLNFVLSGLGYWSAKKLEHPITARTFTTCSLASAPAQLAQIGGFVYDRFHHIGIDPSNYINLDLNSNPGIFTLIILGLMILTPIAYLGFSILCESKNALLTFVYMVISTLLLAPYRGTLPTVILIVAMIALTVTAFSMSSLPSVLESKIAKSVFAVPLLIVIGRQLLFEDAIVFKMFLSAMVSVVIYFFAAFKVEEKLNAERLQILSALPAIYAITLAKTYFSFSFSIWLICISILFQLMSTYAVLNKRQLLGLATIPMSVAVLNSLFEFSVYYKLSILLWISLELTFAVYVRSKMLVGVTVACTVALLISILGHIVTIPEVELWQVLILAGVAFVVVAGVLDKYMEKIKASVSSFYKTLS